MNETILLLFLVWVALAAAVYVLVDCMLDRRNKELRRQNEQLAKAVRDSDGDT